MSKKERIKLEIDVLKALLIAFLTAIFGIASYCVLNYVKINFIQAIIIILGFIVIFTLLFFFCKRIYKILKEIEDIE